MDEIIKSNFQEVVNSVLLDKDLINDVNIELFNKEEQDYLIDLIINKGYVLNSKSPNYLRGNIKVVMSSLKNSLDSLEYASNDIKNSEEVIKYFKENNLIYFKYFLKKKKISEITDYRIFNLYLEALINYRYDDKEFKTRVNKLIINSVITYPKVSTFKGIFDSIARNRWQEFRLEFALDFENIFGKICSILRDTSNFKRALNKMNFLDHMKRILKDKYNLLYDDMKKYFTIYHSDNNMDRLKPYQDEISKLSSLYVATSKEDFIKSEIEDYYYLIKQYFKLKIDNPLIKKQIIEKKRWEKIKYLIKQNDNDFKEHLNSIVNKYNIYMSSEILNNLINEFINNKLTNLDDIINTSKGYSDYIRYNKAKKLINRLNSGYIKYEDDDLSNYRDLIKFNKKYEYIGKIFNEKDIEIFEEYQKKRKIFDQIKKEIIYYIDKLNFDNNNDEEIIDELSEKFPFTDEYFTFDLQTLNLFDLNVLYESLLFNTCNFNKDSFISDEYYSLLSEIFINNGIIWLLIFLYRSVDTITFDFNSSAVLSYINNIPKIYNLIKDTNYCISTFNDFFKLNDIAEFISKQDIAILGYNIVEVLCKSTDFTDGNIKRIIEEAVYLVSEKVKREKSTVPFIKGEYLDYKYSLYDFLENDEFISGPLTDSCLKVGGNDHDLLTYCCLNKNGFMVKITDREGNFIGRVAGIRNGNSVYFNQLRTIYDVDNSYDGLNDSEKNSIIETFKKICNDLIKISHENENVTIDHVFVTRSFCLCKYPKNLSKEVIQKIGCNPIINYSDDWYHFINNTKYLQYARRDDYIETDYGNYPVICMASIKDINNIDVSDIKFGDVSTTYERVRNKVIVSNVNEEVINKINKIHGINTYLSNKEFHYLKIPNESMVIIGDNWYIVMFNNEVIDECVLDFDDKAVKEYCSVKTLLDEDDNILTCEMVKKLIRS